MIIHNSFVLLLQPSWNPLETLRLLFAYHFMKNAFLAGTLIALVAGPVGYFMVLRGQSFLGHTLSRVGFAGAAGAVLFGISPVVGLLVFGSCAALGIGVLGEREGRMSVENDIAIGTVLVFSLSLGLLFIRLASSYAANVYSFLFGTILGISDHDVWVTALTASIALAILAVIARPLLFVSIDPDVAAARGVPVRLISYIFMLLLAISVAVAVQVVGVLLIFALLVTPAATAQQLTARPTLGVGLSVGLAVLVVWLGLSIAYFSGFPIGFAVTSIAFGLYLGSRAWRGWCGARLRRTNVSRVSGEE
ncbi:MAG TPA: metal ABC transporter permease [Nitrolancea sp.]|jgi:zinc/manganese transport system permease protein|nr:metal ABC transporter permease [Nitrolancea sp.]